MMQLLHAKSVLWGLQRLGSRNCHGRLSPLHPYRLHVWLPRDCRMPFPVIKGSVRNGSPFPAKPLNSDPNILDFFKILEMAKK